MAGAQPDSRDGLPTSRRSRYKTLPDVFVYDRPIDLNRPSLAVGLDGPPILIIEVLSESTYDVDLDLKNGKGYSYAHAGVGEYLALDPIHAYVPEGGRAWRLEQGVYQPWEPDADGRWRSARIDVSIGLEGAMATVYTCEGGRQLHEGEVGAELAETLTKGLAEGRTEGLVEGQRQALRALARARFGDLPQVLEQRVAAADAAALTALIERAATTASLDAL
ncbi:MAG: Uma2 family endonuclease [Chloroflexi bacterium]|nr:Uma2 family endonuclease [Chloroflexota bacterium]